jgi:hypothetical protein
VKLEELIFDPSNELFLTESQLWEMARVKPANSGLPWIIFISSKDYVQQRHWARLKVSNVKGTFSSNDNFSVSISKEPKVLAGKAKMDQAELDDIFDWIIINYEPLMKYWNDEYESDAEVYSDLKKI